MSRPITVLRPEPGNSETVDRVRRAGFSALSIPLFDVVPVIWQPPDPADFDLLVLSSANALRHGGVGLERLTQLPVLAVGDATARLARDMGFTVRFSGQEGIEAALRGVPDLDRCRIVHLGGRHRTPVAPPVSCTVITVYESEPITPRRDRLAAAEGTVALLHSGRAAAWFTMLFERFGLRRQTVRLACLSAAVRTAAGANWADARIADRPTDAALIVTAARLTD